MKTDRQVDNNHQYHAERVKGNTIIRDDTLAKNNELTEQKRNNERVSYLSNSSSLLGSIIIILVAVTIIRVLYYGSAYSVTFGSLLDFLQGVPQVSTNLKNFVQQLQIPGPWVLLDGIRTFLNLNLQVVSIVVWLASSLIDVCFFISYFLMWLFV